MQITKLILNNFSSYEDENIFDLSVDEGKPIVLIGGQNGAGKTSLFTAIKIALYGPLAFGYTAFNSFYFKKIKSFINYKAFQYNDLNSGVSIELKIKNEREIKTYTIKRVWSIDDTKIVEEYSVFADGVLMNDSEKSFFESYLNSIIPPDLFDFFLFDGEEVGNIFSEENYNKYVKNSIMTMCGIDAFSIVQNFCRSYMGRSNTALDEALSVQFRTQEEELFRKKNEIEAKTAGIESFQKQIDEQAVLIEQKEREYLRAGGLLKEKTELLEKEASELNKKRELLAHKTKAFFETLLPFYIAKKLIPQIEDQINYEEKQGIFEYVRYMISQDFLTKTLQGKASDPEEISQVIYESIMERLKPSQSRSSGVILDLSKDDQSRIEQIIDSVDSIDTKKMISAVKRKENYTERVVAINREIREALSGEDGREFLVAIDNAKEKIMSLQIAKHEAEEELEECRREYGAIEHELELTRKSIVEEAQSKHIYDLSSSISEIMGKVIADKCVDLRKKLAEYTLRNIKQIYRKENLISIIDVSEDFRFELYQQRNYSADELLSLMTNLGTTEFYRTIGSESRNILCKELSAGTVSELTAKLNECRDLPQRFEIYKKVELTALSKGERQIFILALYWSIIQISGKTIPFIIDTPYARIDANHREEISEKFFPGISSQVVILSTDEEITKDYYSIIKPYISKEYLLSNDKSENRTTISEGYFFKED